MKFCRFVWRAVLKCSTYINDEKKMIKWIGSRARALTMFLYVKTMTFHVIRLSLLEKKKHMIKSINLCIEKICIFDFTKWNAFSFKCCATILAATWCYIKLFMWHGNASHVCDKSCKHNYRSTKHGPVDAIEFCCRRDMM